MRQILIEEGKWTEKNPWLAKPRAVRSCSLNVLGAREALQVPCCWRSISSVGQRQPLVSAAHPHAQGRADVDVTPPCSQFTWTKLEISQHRGAVVFPREEVHCCHQGTHRSPLLLERLTVSDMKWCNTPWPTNSTGGSAEFLHQQICAICT